jgi:protein SCO1
MRLSFVPAAVACLAMAGALTAAAHDGHVASSRDGYVRSLARYEIPDARLVDMNGNEVSLRERLASGAPLMVNFVFTSCTAICPVMSATFARVQQSLAGEANAVELVSISIDPEHDTPARLLEYAAKFSAGPHWRFLTGSAEASIAVQRAFDVFRGDKMGHDPVTFIRASPKEPWLRIEGWASASDLVGEYRRIARR